MRRPSLCALLAAGIGLLDVAPVVAQRLCKPALTFAAVEFSAMQPPTMQRIWTAIVSADASACATTAGYFEIGFLRLKENGLDVEFRQQYIWLAPSVKVSLDFWADEAVERYWLDNVPPCPCRN